MSHVKFEFHSNRDTLTYLTAKTRSKSFFRIPGLKNYIEASDLIHTYIVSVLTTADFRHGWAIFGPLADKKHSKGGVSRAPSQRKVFWTFFQQALRYQFETWYIHLVGSATHQVKIFIAVWSPWPTLEPRMGQCNFSSFMASKII